MKSAITSVLAFILPIFLAFFGDLQAADMPTLTAPEAARIAQEDLASRGLDSSIFILEMSYKGQKLIGSGPAYWEVFWSKEFDAQTAGRKEIGLKIKMDGSFTRSVR